MDSVSEYIAAQAFGEEKTIDFNTFANWYSTDGYHMMSWVELLDLKKWPEGVNPEGSLPPVFEVHGSGVCVSVFPADIQMLRQLATISGLGTVSVSELKEVIEEHTSEDETLSDVGVSKAISSLMVFDDVTLEEREWCENALDRIFYAYAITDTGSASASAFFIGLSVPVGGTPETQQQRLATPSSSI